MIQKLFRNKNKIQILQSECILILIKSMAELKVIFQ